MIAHPCDKYAEPISPRLLRSFTFERLREKHGMTPAQAFDASMIFYHCAKITEEGRGGIWECNDPDGWSSVVDGDFTTIEKEDILRKAGLYGVVGLCAAGIEEGEIVRGDECWGFLGCDAYEPWTLLDFARDVVRLARAAQESALYAGFNNEEEG